MPSLDLLIWKLLSKRSCLVFGEECTSVILWVMISLMLRTVLVLLNIEHFIPRGFIFAFPLFAQFLGGFFPLLKKNYPILPVRIAECMLGKTTPSQIFIVIPAHLFGGLLGIVFFRSIFPFIPNKVYAPINFENCCWMTGSVTEVVYNFLYTVVILILPHVLEVNRMSSLWINLPISSLFVFSAKSTYNPAIVYGLWYIQSCSVYKNVGDLPIERVVVPLAAAIIAGLFCNIFFPEDPTSWIRKKSL